MIYPLRFTLTWTDPAENPNAGVKLVNDLDLIVAPISDSSPAKRIVPLNPEGTNRQRTMKRRRSTSAKCTTRWAPPMT